MKLRIYVGDAASTVSGRGYKPSLHPWPVENQDRETEAAASRFPREDGDGFDIPLGIADEELAP